MKVQIFINHAFKEFQSSLLFNLHFTITFQLVLRFIFPKKKNDLVYRAFFI